MNACPTINDWQSLLHGALADAVVAELEAHLGACPGCRATLEKLSGGTTMFTFTKEPPRQPDESSELERVMARLKGQTGREDETWDIRPLLKPSSRSEAIGCFAAYDVLEIIAHGGMGIVVKAYDPALQRIVAIKILAPSLAEDAGFRERFLREARAAAALDHDHVVVIHSVGEEAGLPFIVMQHMPGPSLQQRLDAEGPLSPAELILVGRQIASALTAAHAAGLIHRDVKPSNVLMEDGLARVRITDFGLVHSVNRPAGSEERLIAGTPQFMSPEQAGGETITTATDLFSLGATLYILASGRPPFQASRITELLEQVRSGAPAPIEQLRPELPGAIRELIQRLMSRDAALRPSAREVYEALIAMERPRSRSGLVGGALTVSVLLVFAAIGVVRFGSDRPTPVRFRIEPAGAVFDSLHECIAAAQPGDTIEISGTGSVEVASVRIEGKPLRFRAAPGARPVLVGTNNLRPILESDSPLVLEGLTIEHRITFLDAPPAIRVTNAPLRLAFCRLLKTSLVPRMIPDRIHFIEAYDAPLVELAHCEVLSLERAAGIVFSRFTRDSLAADPGVGTIRIEQSLLTGLQAVEVENRQSGPVLLQLVRSAFINRTLLRLDDTLPSNSVKTRADQNVFDVESLISAFASGREDLSRQLEWVGRDNHYSVRLGFVAEPREARSVLRPGFPRNLAQWTSLESVIETGSQSARLELWKEIQDAGNKSESLQAGKIKLPTTVTMTAPPDLGRIGPGAPYQTWRNSADYAAWERAAMPGEGR